MSIEIYAAIFGIVCYSLGILNYSKHVQVLKWLAAFYRRLLSSLKWKTKAQKEFEYNQEVAKETIKIKKEMLHTITLENFWEEQAKRNIENRNKPQS